MRISIIFGVSILLLILFLGCAQTGPEQKTPTPTTTVTVTGESLEKVYQGFKSVEKGDWAEWTYYSDGEKMTVKYIFAGRETLNGKEVYGLEFSAEMQGQKGIFQVWYYEDTGEVAKYVLKTPQGIFCLTPTQYKPSDVEPTTETPDEYEPENIVKYNYEIGTYTTKSGKTISVVKIIKGNEEFWVSSEVPFGLVKVIRNGKTVMELDDFGSGESPVISFDEVKSCKQMQLPIS